MAVTGLRRAEFQMQRFGRRTEPEGSAVRNMKADDLFNRLINSSRLKIG
jgi:hypothetical protein